MMSGMSGELVQVLPECLLFLVCSFLFGVVLKLSDLLQEHGYRWFRGSAMATGLFGSVLLLLVLSEAEALQRLFWLAVLLHWILRGRIDAANHGLPTVAALLWLAFRDPTLLAQSAGVFSYFFIPLTLLGFAHDVYQYTELPGPTWLKEFFRNQHLYWYAVILGHVLVSRLDLPFLVSGLAFVKGYGMLYSERATSFLPRLGIEPPS